MEQPSNDSSRPTEKMYDDHNGFELQSLDSSSHSHRTSTEVFPEYSENYSTSVLKERRRCPRCRAPNNQENSYTIIYCISCSKPFQWENAEKINTKRRPRRSSNVALMKAKMVEKDISLESRNTKVLKRRARAGLQHFDERLSGENADKLVSGQESTDTTGELTPETLEQLSEKEKCVNTSRSRPVIEPNDLGNSCRRKPRCRPPKSVLHNNSKATSISSNHFIELSGSRNSHHSYNTSHSLPSSSTTPTICQQPARYVPMTMRPTANLSAAYATISSASEAYVKADAVKETYRTRQQEIQDYTTWQKIKWRCQLKPCTEAPEGCFYKSKTQHGRVDGEGKHGDGCCEIIGCRACCCTYGCQIFGPAACCEGCGCVKCCGVEHGCWDALDVCFGQKGCVTSCFRALGFCKT